MSLSKYTLKHQIYTDDFGIKRDSFTVIKTLEDGHRVIKPIHTPIKVTNHLKDKSILDDTQVWTQEEFDELLAKNSDF